MPFEFATMHHYLYWVDMITDADADGTVLFLVKMLEVTAVQMRASMKQGRQVLRLILM